METRKLKIAYAFLLLMPAVALLQTSCSDNESDDVATGQGSVEITANWDDYSEDAELPGNYILAVAGVGESIGAGNLRLFALIGKKFPGNLLCARFTVFWLQPEGAVVTAIVAGSRERERRPVGTDDIDLRFGLNFA